MAAIVGCGCRQTLVCLVVSIFATIFTSGLPAPGLPEDLNWITSGSSSEGNNAEFPYPAPVYVPSGMVSSRLNNIFPSNNNNADRYAALSPYHYFTVARRAVWGKPQVRPLTGRELDQQTLQRLESLSAANYDDIQHVNPNMFGEISRLVRDLAGGVKHRPTNTPLVPPANGSAAPLSSLTSSSIHDHGASDSESGLMDFVGSNGMHALMPRIGKRNVLNGQLPRWLLASIDGDNNLAFGNEKFRAERSTNGAMGLAVPRVG